eukprot:g9219.t1
MDDSWGARRDDDDIGGSESVEQDNGVLQQMEETSDDDMQHGERTLDVTEGQVQVTLGGARRMPWRAVASEIEVASDEGERVSQDDDQEEISDEDDGVAVQELDVEGLRANTVTQMLLAVLIMLYLATPTAAGWKEAMKFWRKDPPTERDLIRTTVESEDRDLELSMVGRCPPGYLHVKTWRDWVPRASPKCVDDPVQNVMEETMLLTDMGPMALDASRNTHRDFMESPIWSVVKKVWENVKGPEAEMARAVIHDFKVLAGNFRKLENELMKHEARSARDLYHFLGPLEGQNRRLEDRLKDLDKTLRSLELDLHKELRERTKPLYRSEERLEEMIRDLKKEYPSGGRYSEQDIRRAEEKAKEAIEQARKEAREARATEAEAERSATHHQDLKKQCEERLERMKLLLKKLESERAAECGNTTDMFSPIWNWASEQWNSVDGWWGIAKTYLKTNPWLMMTMETAAWAATQATWKLCLLGIFILNVLSFIVRRIASIFKTIDMVADIAARMWKGVRFVGRLIVLVLCNCTKLISDVLRCLYRRCKDKGENVQRSYMQGNHRDHIRERHAVGEQVLNRSPRRRRPQNRARRPPSGNRRQRPYRDNTHSAPESMNVLVVPRPQGMRRHPRSRNQSPMGSNGGRTSRESSFERSYRGRQNARHSRQTTPNQSRTESPMRPRSESPTPSISTQSTGPWERMPQRLRETRPIVTTEVAVARDNDGVVNMVHDGDAQTEFAFWSERTPQGRKTLTLYHVKGKLDGSAQTLSFLVDSGSAVSVLPRRKTQKLGCTVNRSGKGTRLVGFSGNVEEALGSVEKDVTIGRATRRLKFLVSEKAAKPILGLDALQQFGMMINTEEGSLESSDGGKVYCHCVEVKADEGTSAAVPELWEVQGNGLAIEKHVVKIFSGRTHHLSPRTWKRLYLAFKLEVDYGGVTIGSALSRDGLVSGVVLTSGGMMRLDVYNSTSKVVRIAPATQLVTLRGHEEVEIERLQPTRATVESVVSEVEATAESLRQEVASKYPEVADLSSHPIKPAMEELRVRATEVQWQSPEDFGCRTPYRVESVACRHAVEHQIELYIQRGYLRRVSCSEDVYFSPLLPIKKKDGSYRLTTDFRALNAHFSKKGQAQVDVWRKLWSIEPKWKYYAQLDLKDAFFSVPVAEELQRLFAFTWCDRRYCWTRIPQGWTWASVLFTERVAEAISGISGVVQFADDLLIGATDLVSLRSRVLEVFERMAVYGFKVNLEKTSLCKEEIKFLGLEISGGKWSLMRYLEEKVEQFGEISCWKDLERLVGVVSYARRTIPGIEPMLEEVRGLLKESKEKGRSKAWWKNTVERAREMIRRSLDKQRFLTLPGIKASSYLLETDWSEGYGGYLLYAVAQGGKFLCDMGSKKIPEASSSFLGELRALVWSCKSTKAFRGDSDLVIRTDNNAVAVALDGSGSVSEDKRVVRLLAWLLSNEGYVVEYLPGEANRGADLLSRPPRKRQRTRAGVNALECLTNEQEERIRMAHEGHFDAVRTYANLKRQGEVWRGAKEHVKKYVMECPQCRSHARLPRSPSFKTWSVPFPNHTLFLDFCGPWRWEVGGFALHALVACDGFSRFVRTRVVSGPQERVVIDLLRQWISEYGAPRRIVSDQGAAFIGRELRRFCEQHGLGHSFVGVRAHFSNGRVERVIQTLLHRIQRIGRVAPWRVIMSRAVRAYNTTWHSALNCSPSEIFLGVDEHGEWSDTDTWVRKLMKVEERERQRWGLRQGRLGGSGRAEFEIGDMIRLHEPSTSKLGSSWSSPGRIVKKIGSRLYEVCINGKVKGPVHGRHLIVTTTSN